ncbi:hypothetical protein BIFGAL_03962 [Bifidobacterium gallicum DSM 20093 = LMG 11596]|uniref:Uncharacterized protein n=1 Tax=Bifidobacterium gallicum DSM 20093 = LMG 11596 TaxID=561180 RepID=D1NVR9_9BIFI|nr:hypothetical protein BIFGAL_03962 [Bifidobacterium gallicum DSM 20093 = LMG 11596]
MGTENIDYYFRQPPWLHQSPDRLVSKTAVPDPKPQFFLPSWSGRLQFRPPQTASPLTRLVSKTAVSPPKPRLSLPGWSGKLQVGFKSA